MLSKRSNECLWRRDRGRGGGRGGVGEREVEGEGGRGIIEKDRKRNEWKQAVRGKEKGKGRCEQINTTCQYQLHSSLTGIIMAPKLMIRELTDFEMEEIQNESVSIL